MNQCQPPALSLQWQEFLQRAGAKQLRIGVLGLGYVGLPLCVEFASAGYSVTGFDVDHSKVESINNGVSYITDIDSDTLGAVVANGTFGSTIDMSRLDECDTIIICVPTPLSKTRDPDTSYVVAAAEQVAQALRPGQLVILESTTYPGTTRELILPLLTKSGLAPGEDFLLAFSPERVDPGNKIYGIKNTPKVVGGLDSAATCLATLLYEKIVETVHPVSSPEAAEMAKLLENTFRAVNIGLANETALMCNRLGINVWEVIEAASTKPFGFMPFYPGPGIGGHCIPLDPYYLSWKMKTLNYRARFVELAGEVNADMPRHVVQLVTDSLNEAALSVKGARVLVLGVAYKPDVSDPRESPALDVIDLLRRKGALLEYSDPWVPSVQLGQDRYESRPLSPEVIEEADCVVIVTNHSAFDYAEIAKHARRIVDTRNALRQAGMDSGAVIVL